jgi:uncharacterized protein involved in exopolysaccharide biosynthesis
MIKVRAERRDLNNQINAEVKRITNNLENEVAVVTSREQALASGLSELQETAKNDGKASIRLRDLQRETEANRVLYESFLNRFKQTSAQ